MRDDPLFIPAIPSLLFEHFGKINERVDIIYTGQARVYGNNAIKI